MSNFWGSAPQTIRELEANIADLRSKEIWSGEYGERVACWISESAHKISNIEDEIRELEVRLASVRNRLSRL